MSINSEVIKFNESELEQAIIELFKAQDYDYVYGEKIQRRYEDILLLDDLRAFLNERYKNDGLSEVEMQKIINELTLINSTPR